MDFASILSNLTRAQKISSGLEDWQSSVQITNILIEKYPKYYSLQTEVKGLTDKLDRLKQEFISNSEIGKLSREVASINQTITESNEELIIHKNQEKQLNTKIEELELIANPLIAKNKKLSVQESQLQNNITQLEQEIKKQSENHQALVTVLDDITSSYARSSLEEEQLINKLMHLKEREVELRNDAFTTDHKPHDVNLVPVTKAPIPRSTTKSNKKSIVVENVDILKYLHDGNTSNRHSGPITSISFANTSSYVVSGGEDSIVNIISTENYSQVSRITDAKQSIMAATFSPNDQLLCTASYDSGIRVYRVPSFNLALNITENRDCVSDAMFAADDRLVTCCRDRTIKLYDVKKASAISTITSSSIPYSIAVIQGESMVVTAHHDGKLRCWDFRTHGSPIEIKAHKAKAIQVIGTRGSMKLVSLGVDKRIAVSDLRAKAVAGRVSIEKSGLPSEKMQMCLYENSAICGSTNGEIYDYDLEDFSLKSSIKGHTAPVFCIAIKPQTGLLVSGDKSGVIKFWNK
ncbi:autophagy-related protein 16 [Histomonas meleagridis]|uniref:autophagy-related protein 16 n=1 Tax=Histomonas meleagridis TaxID=135588 RepID=UPI003559579D|nr:autophagy-related protein 16 [Histomonas meleagridis]KAH0801458.1 autophagy-related protein 16 [Histomonas meleagridis]